MEKEYCLWMRGKDADVLGWIMAEWGDYTYINEKLFYFLKLKGKAHYWKIAEEGDVSWMDWYK